MSYWIHILHESFLLNILPTLKENQHVSFGFYFPPMAFLLVYFASFLPDASLIFVAVESQPFFSFCLTLRSSCVCSFSGMGWMDLPRHSSLFIWDHFVFPPPGYGLRAECSFLFVLQLEGIVLNSLFCWLTLLWGGGVSSDLHSVTSESLSFQSRQT